MERKSVKKEKESRKKLIRIVIKSTILAILISFVLFFLLLGSTYIGIWGKLPTYAELDKIKNDEASRIYSSDNKLIGKFYLENRITLNYNKISPDVFNALVATEDARFYEHSGVDSRSILRVIFKSLLLGDKSSGGGSTLSQQLAKNLYGRKSHSILSMPVIKVKEMITASRLEKIYTKDEIITLYLNTVPFGESVFGIESASQRYFDTSADKLTTTQAATLVGMLKAPSAYNPRLYPERSKNRRNTVINQMVKYKFLDNTLAENLKKKPLNLRYRRLGDNTGPATYFRENLRQEVKKIVKDYNERNRKDINMYRDGLNIYTTIDSRLQQYAEEAVKEHMEALQKSFYSSWEKREPWYKHPEIVKSAVRRSDRYKSLKRAKIKESEIEKIFKTKVKMEIYSPFSEDKAVYMSPIDSVKHYLKILHTGFMAMDPRNGKIKAWVGGIDHKYFKYDMVKAKRQTGSVFKPIVYAAALENGESPNNYYENKRTVYPEYKDWSPRNSSDDEYTGFYSMKGALAHSINTIAVEVLLKTGIDKTIDLAKEMGIESKLTNFPSIALGASNSSLYEMVQAFSTFANNGEWVKPYYITKITDKNGNIIFEKKGTERRTVMDSDNANIINHMLEAVVNEGTGSRLRNIYGLTNTIAGKTGTTQDNADGWFIGYNPHIVAGIRTGADDMRIHFRSTYLGQGANTALPIFGIFMRKALRDSKFAYWNNMNFPSINAISTQETDIPMYKNNLDIIQEINTDKIINLKATTLEKEKLEDSEDNKNKEEKRPNIFQKIKNIFKKN